MKEFILNIVFYNSVFAFGAVIRNKTCEHTQFLENRNKKG